MSALRRLVEQHYANVAAGDSDADEALFSPDVVTVEPAVGTLHGFAAFRAYTAGFHRAFPDGRLVLESAVEDGAAIAVEGRFVGTQTGPMMGPQGELPPTGRALDLPFADLFQVEAGRVVRHRVYYDHLAFLTQLGLVPPPGSDPPVR